jgi:hypothetical protein
MMSVGGLNAKDNGKSANNWVISFPMSDLGS